MRSKSEELMLRIREYIESYFERYSSTPTVREIAGAMRIAVSSAHRYLVAMAEKDMVFYENGALSTPKIRRMNPAVSPAAIVGSIPCGSPEEKEARVEEYLPPAQSVSSERYRWFPVTSVVRLTRCHYRLRFYITNTRRMRHLLWHPCLRCLACLPCWRKPC